MQDSNNENTQPIQPHQDNGETVPTRTQRTEAAPTASTGVPEQPKRVLSGDDTVAVTPNLYAQKPKKPTGPRRWRWILIGILLLVLFAGAGSWMGYQSAVQMRKAQQEEQRVTTATEHFMLGMDAQTKKQYEIAKRQFEYVIRLDPNFPGAQDKLREVLVAMSVANTPTPAPTVALPTLTPTLDTRPQEEIYNQAKQQYAAKDWDGLFATIDSLRRIDPKYKAVEIDGMLYIALRFRGIDKILHQANLEGGLYDLALAERFGPLDVDAIGYRNWARLYLNGASFWEVDWPKVMQYFEEIYPYFPNMRDSSGMTAIERYRIAAKSEGDRLMAAGDACAAYDYYEKSLNAVADATLAQKATEVYLVCHPPEPTATPTPSFTPTGQVITPEISPTVETPQVTQEIPTNTTETPPAPAGGSSPRITATPSPKK